MIKFVSDSRSVFPSSGPLEEASCSLLESAYRGDQKKTRDLLMHHHVYVDVSDAHGLTALHFSTYNVHIDIVNLLLDFGANVNQFTDDSLTPLTIAFLLYYGNDPYLTINTALEHIDPVISIVKPTPVIETARSKDRNPTSSRTSNNPTRQMISRIATIEEEKLPTQFELIKLRKHENRGNI